MLLSVRQHAVAISGDIKGMFHQIRLLPQDKPLLRFLWRNMNKSVLPSVYQWQVLPFGTTCSPCCATYALQKHVKDNSSDENVQYSVTQCFYVDNCLQSFPSSIAAQTLLDKLRATLSAGGFDLRQWASNDPLVISHLPPEAKSQSSELWLSEDRADPQERTLGLLWNCKSDSLGYKYSTCETSSITMRHIYRVLARLYDPLGYLLPFTTRAKILVQQLWRKERGWDDPLLPHDLLTAWKSWEEELYYLPQITIPRCCTSKEMDATTTIQDIHIFCDASEHAYGSVAYLRSEDSKGQVELSFILARSRVCPKRQLSIPRLELCAALSGASLCDLIRRELTLPIRLYTLD